MGNFLIKERTSLEDAFFLKQDKILIEKLKQLEKMKKTKEEYKKVSGINNDHVLQKFIDLDIPVDIVACLAVVPLIEVAWADGNVDDKEKKYILENSEKFGVSKQGIELELIERWLQHRPETKLLDAWFNYIHGICENMSPQEKEEFKKVVLEHIYEIANVSGGLFNTGIGNKISKKEKEVIGKLENAFN
ncbi:MAG: TerB family tellurite resistance protein [Oligoflexia bacterium]|nr:TerB family tellurite resistance protein [Oligoflexia bacterium]